MPSFIVKSGGGILRLFLSDFIRIGAIMETMEILDANRKAIRLIGNLRYRNESINIKIKVDRGGVARIISVVGETRETAYRNLESLRKIRREALRLNVNNLRKAVISRTVSIFLWYFCILLHMIMQLIVVRYALLNGVVIMPILLSAIILFSIRKLINNKWEIIPYGANRHGWI